ncbi:ABC-three component system protein [Lactococcus lactis]|uniref:ABC-three component system protein n=1 Tax=Lactococcus lactis TaxID=1358 RepID=UPI003D2BD0CC
MNTQDYYNNISTKLAILEVRIKNNSKLNILDLNVHSENFYRDLLNIIYDLELVNANGNVSNYAAIDLIDDRNKILYQVSSTGTRQKIENTLNKEKVEFYAKNGFRLGFVFLVGDLSSLRGKFFKNKYKINFDSRNSIFDPKSILNDIQSLDIERYKEVNDLFNKYFNSDNPIKQITSELASVVNSLSKKSFSMLSNPQNLNEFNIDDKIDINELNDIQSTTIDIYKVYSNRLDTIYKSYEDQGKINRLVVLGKVAGFYESELRNRNTSSVEKFLNIIDLTKEYALKSRNIEDMEDDVLELCVKIIVVDAFVRCRIFKKPRTINNSKVDNNATTK